MAGRIRVGVDLDGVVADFTGGWVRLYNAEFGASLTPEHVTTWDAPERLTHFGTMTDFWRWARTAGGRDRSLFAELEPYPGAVAGLRALPACPARCSGCGICLTRCSGCHIH